MVNEQPEALRLAYAICDYSRYWQIESEQVAKLRRMKVDTEAAAELRRLHQVNQELLAALKEANACILGDHWGNALDVLGAAIAKAERTTT